MRNKSNVEKIRDVKPKRVPRGRTLSTNDNYLGKQKTNSKKKRTVVVIETNSNNEMAVVPLSSRDGENRTKLKNYTQGNSYFKHYVETKDNEGQPIVTNDKFRQNNKDLDISLNDVGKIRNKVFTNCKQKQRNNKVMNEFRNRK